MTSVPIDNRVDVTVSLGTQPISKASFDSALFLADIETGGEGASGFSEMYRVYNSIDGVIADNFTPDTPVYKVALLVFGGKFPVSNLFVVNINTGFPAGDYIQTLGDFLDSETDEPYYVMAETNSTTTIKGIAALCEAKGKMFVTSVSHTDILSNSDLDLGSQLQDLSYDHVLTLFSRSTEYPEAGIVGAMAAIPAGTSTLEDKTLVGVAPDVLTASDRLSLEQKNVAYYASIAGVNSVFNSKVASGQFFDTIVFSDWLQARLSEEIYGLFKRESDLGRKVAMDSTGFAKVRQACWNVIRLGQANGSVSPDIEPVVRTPNRDDISAADKANRVLPDVVVELLYSGAIHKVLVRAYVTV